MTHGSAQEKHYCGRICTLQICITAETSGHKFTLIQFRRIQLYAIMDNMLYFGGVAKKRGRHLIGFAS